MRNTICSSRSTPLTALAVIAIGIVGCSRKGKPQGRSEAEAPGEVASTGSPPSYEEVRIAILRNEKGKIREFLDRRGDVNARGTNGGTLLSAAVFHLVGETTDMDRMTVPAGAKPDLDVLKWLLERGADPVAEGDGKRTALHMAVTIRDRKTVVPVVKLLIDKRAGHDTRDYEGRTALYLVALYQDDDLAVELARLLLQKDARVDSADGYGITPLHVAASAGKAKLVQFLLDNGTDVNVASRFGATPLHGAAVHEHLDVAEVLIANGADLSAKTRSPAGRRGFTPLHVAVGGRGDGVEKGRRAEMVEFLISKGADVDGGHKTPLHLAIEGRKTNLARVLLEEGKADPNAKGGCNQLPLCMAAMKVQTEIVRLLLEAGADVNTGKESGWTALASAAWADSENADLAKLLLERGAEVNTSDKYGHTPLHRAAKRSQQEIIKLLLSHGADINARTKKGETPLSLADDKDTAEILRQQGGVE